MSDQALEELARRVGDLERRLKMIEANDQAPRACQVTRNSNQTIANFTWTLVTWTVRTYDPLNMHTGTNNYITVPVPGLYVINFAAVFASNSAGNRGLSLSRNSTVLGQLFDYATSGGTWYNEITISRKLDANDQIKASVFQSSGGNLDLQYLSEYSPIMTVTRVG